MRSFEIRPRLAAMLALLSGAWGCGSGVNESQFAPTQGSAPPDAPKTPAEVDARTPKPRI